MNTFSRLTLPLTLALLLTSTVPALAVSPSPAAAAQARLTALIAKSDKDITARTTSLTDLISKVSAAARLTDGQKSTLVAAMNDQITQLNQLKVKVDADTDITVLRTDFADIFQEHFIYAFFVPMVNRLLAADGISDAATLLTNLEPTLQGYLTQASQAGKDVTTMQTAFNDLKAKVADANTLSTTAISQLSPLTAAGYPGNLTTVKAAATSLKTARSDLKTARQDADTIVKGLRQDLNNVQ